MSPTGADRPRRPPEPWAWEGHRRLLAVADVQTGYHHDSLSHALATVERLGREHDAFRTMIRTDSQLITRAPIVGQGTKYGGKPVNARALPDFDALLLLPSGAGTLSEAQKEDLLAWVRDDGKGLVLGHAAILGFYDWPAFGELCGARLGGEFVGEVTVHVEDPTFPGIADAFGPGPFCMHEQHPIVAAPYRREDVHVILRIDAESVDATHRARRPDGDFPVVWTRRYGRGRIFHCGWGHYEATWDDPRFQRLMLAGIRWAMGAAPSP